MDNKALLEYALAYAEKDLAVFPLNGKRPALKSGKNHGIATTCPNQIRKWWAGKYAGCNIGLVTGDTNKFWVLDIDGPEGEVNIERLIAQCGDLPKTAVQTTSNGRHIFFRMGKVEVKNSVQEVAPGIDVRGTGGYIVAAPSIHPDTQNVYEWANNKIPSLCDMASAPNWLIEKVSINLGDEANSPAIPPLPFEAQKTVDYPEIRKLCSDIKSAPNGAQESTLSKSAYRAGILVGESQISENNAITTLNAAGEEMKSYDAKNPWTLEQIQKKVQVGVNAGINKNANEVRESKETIKSLNDDHAVVMVGGKCVVLKEGVDMITNNKTTTFMAPADFKNFHCDKKVKVGDKKIPLGQAWFTNPKRRKYDGVVFSPTGAPNNLYNLWQGFAVEPKEGDCQLYLDHIHDNIAGGDSEVYDFVLNFMADAIQNPGKKPGVALVLRGDQGVGKGVFVQNFGKLFGQHFLHLSSSHHLLGHFNSSLKEGLIVFADEAFWAGDKKAEGRLKALVTEDTNMIEFKGKDAFPVRNYVRLVAASNNDWVVPAGPSERRFCVLDVHNEKIQDSEYFGNIIDQMKTGGQEALMHLLLNRDLTGVNLRDFPKTTALQEQKIQSMDAIDKWWLDVLMRGYFLEETEKWGSKIPTKDIFESLKISNALINQRMHASQTQLGIKLTNLVPGLEKFRITDSGRNRSYYYKFPPLKVCRQQFSNRTGIDFVWKRDSDQKSDNGCIYDMIG